MTQDWRETAIAAHGAAPAGEDVAGGVTKEEAGPMLAQELERVLGITVDAAEFADQARHAAADDVEFYLGGRHELWAHVRSANGETSFDEKITGPADLGAMLAKIDAVNRQHETILASDVEEDPAFLRSETAEAEPE